MKTYIRYISIVLSSFVLALMVINDYSDLKFLSNFLSENYGFKFVFFVLIFFMFLIIYTLTYLIMGFIGAWFYKLATPNKDLFDLQKAQFYCKTNTCLLIMVHVIATGLKIAFGKIYYFIFYFIASLFVTIYVTYMYKKRYKGIFNAFIAMLPQIMYMAISLYSANQGGNYEY